MNMRGFRILVAGALLCMSSASAAFGEDAESHLFGRVLSLVQSVVHTATQSGDPKAVEKRIDGLLSGQDAEFNRLAGDILSDAFEGMPPQYRGSVMALAKDLAVLARRERARDAYRQSQGAEAALQARKDLAAMGLRYFDSAQLLDAVKRNDLLAVELFIAARGVDLGVRDIDGLTALQVARRRNNRQLADVLAAAGG